MISVIIPVYNRFHLVKQMIDCIISQSYKDWELILVDDGSSDENFLKLKEYVSYNNYIKCIQRREGKKGAPSCRNLGLRYSSGKYVVFFDSDDLVAPYCLEQRVSFMDAHSDLDAAIFPARHFTKTINEEDGLLNGIPIYSNDLAAFFSSSLPYIVWNVIFKRDALIKAQIVWDENLLSLQDSDYNIQCILKGLRIAYAIGAKIDYYARIENNDSISSSIFSQSRFDSHIYFVNKQLTSLSDNQLKRFRFSLYHRIIYSYLLMSYNYSKVHIDKLITLSKHYHCLGYLLSVQILLNTYLIKIFKIPHKFANAITFPSFLIKKRIEARKRNKYRITFKY